MKRKLSDTWVETCDPEGNEVPFAAGVVLAVQDLKGLARCSKRHAVRIWPCCQCHLLPYSKLSAGREVQVPSRPFQHIPSAEQCTCLLIGLQGRDASSKQDPGQCRKILLLSLEFWPPCKQQTLWSPYRNLVVWESSYLAAASLKSPTQGWVITPESYSTEQPPAIVYCLHHLEEGAESF